MDLHDEDERGVEKTNVKSTKIVNEAALGVRRKAPKKNDSKITRETRDLIKKCKKMKDRVRKDKTEVAEFTKCSNKKIWRSVNLS